MRIRRATLLAAAVVSFAGVAAQGQGGILDPGPAGAPAVERPEYAGSIGKMTPMEIIQQKAQMKAAQRQSRIAAREWYGYSQSRPKTSATPFSGMYGAQFQGHSIGRPSAHYAQRPILIIGR